MSIKFEGRAIALAHALAKVPFDGLNKFELRARLLEMMTEDERNEVVNIYLAYLRVVEGVEFVPSVTYRPLGTAIEWYCKREFNRSSHAPNSCV